MLNIVFRELKKIRENKVKEKELKKVKAYLKGGTLLNLENTTNRMLRIASSMMYFKRIISVEEFLEDIESVTADDLLKLANDVLNEDKLIKVILKSNESRIPKVA